MPGAWVPALLPVYSSAHKPSAHKRRHPIVQSVVRSSSIPTGFLRLFGVAVALAAFSAARYYTVSWLGERITTDVRNAVYRHVLRQSPSFFETTQSGEVLSRLTNDTTLVQTVVGSSFSMGLRNLIMGVGAFLLLVWAHPWLMLQVTLLLVLVIVPSVRAFSRSLISMKSMRLIGPWGKFRLGM